ncbi:dUTP diphosphatase [Leptospira idonii]|uniref:Deoxyuridine 5'-triphosphate nucleotidohydrolase n=1 Tax=Leptospira idonii TaxID=1193500 RepID=A0A4V3JXZ9_9LEPT|nr:dUTP diphosphatase [Leptospira idonii]TGN19346.1 dUTP diphosphatase [Leptospira idonii]
MQVPVQILKPGAVLPDRKSNGAAGYDLSACLESDLILPVGEVVLVPTGLAFAIPDGFEGQVRPRSGFSTKNRILMPNSPGTIDSDYRGEIFVPLLNLGKADFVLEHGTRIAQILVKRYEAAEFTVVSTLEETQRGTGGFGSTGK